MSTDAVAHLSESSIFSLSLWMFALGALVVLLIILFALALVSARHWRWWRKEPDPTEMLLHELLHTLHDPARCKDALSAGALAATVYGEYLSRRNDFWLTYGQITVAVLLLIVVTVLLLTRTINPDAGLPILSGIAGFAIAKGPAGSRGFAPRSPEAPQG